MNKIEIHAIAVESWNACRRDVYALAEDMQDGYAVDVTKITFTEAEIEAAHHFNRGYMFAAKTFARAFNSLEAVDADKMADIFAKIAVTD